MRVAVLPLFTAVAACLAPLASARATRYKYENRQVSPRATTTDTCASLANWPLAVLISPNIPPVTIGLINVCLCESSISGFINSNIVALAAIAVAGRPATVAALTNGIQSAVGHRECVYPENTNQICSANNVCGFSCQNGFTAAPAAFPTTCVCLAPNIICNGLCLSAPACPSQVPKVKKRKYELQARQDSCAQGETACGVFGWYGRDSVEPWECIDTKTDLESCGGCMVPFGNGPATGVDCSSLPGVWDVQCLSGTCSVSRCLPGYAISSDKTHCVGSEDLGLAFGSGYQTVNGIEELLKLPPQEE